MVNQLGLFEASSANPAPPAEPTSPQYGEAPRWKDLLNAEFESDYYRTLRSFVKHEREVGKTIYPPDKDIFNALSFTPFDTVKVVILGQDPYHGPNQAHGLCFSVKSGVSLPPSLQNIFKELNDDLGIPTPKSGSLERWARQGVLLLNAVLTVEAGKPASHQGKGWEQLTDRIVQLLNEKRSGLIFLLWGAYAQKKGAFIDPQRHHVLSAPHPSPFSVHKGFFGCRHFSKANEILVKSGRNPIDWNPV